MSAVTPEDPTPPSALGSPRSATSLLDSFLLGNGRLGATVWGGVPTEAFDLNADTLWSGGPWTGSARPDPSVLGSIRQAIADGDQRRADELACALQSDRWTESYQPVGRLLWDWAGAQSSDEGPPDEYERELDLQEAVATTRSGSARLRAFVSAPDDVLVAETDSGRSGSLRFESPHPDVTIATRAHDADVTLTAVGRAPAIALPAYIDDPDPLRYAADQPDTDGTVPAGMGWALAARLTTDGATTRLIATVVTGFRGHDQRPSADLAALVATAERIVDAAAAHTTEALRHRHREDYRLRFDQTRLDLSGSGAAAVDAQRLFDLGRYLLISSSRPGSEAANLQGVWSVDRQPAWSANHTTNINTQMNYWGAEQVGLRESTEPLFRLIEQLTATGASTAGRVYGARGSAAHHNTDLWRLADPVPGEPQWANWPSALTWLSTHLLSHLEFGWDADFARHTAEPVLRSVVQFVIDMLVETPDGHLVTSPSTSPEHPFVTTAGERGAVTAGATLDQELALQVTAGFVALCERLGIDDPLVDECRDTTPRLRLPHTDRDGRLAEWAGSMTGFEPGHRHVSHLYGVYPGSRITETRTPDAFAAARTALAARLSAGGGHTGWSRAWVLCLAARFRDADLAEASIASLLASQTSSTLLDLHPMPVTEWPEGAVFQIDGNLGAVAGVAELLLQSHDGALALLPALPKGWPTGDVYGLRARGGHRVDIAWVDGRLTIAVIRCGTTGPLTIDLDDETAAAISDSGRPVRVEFDAIEAGAVAAIGRRRARWQATAGATYVLRAESPEARVGAGVRALDPEGPDSTPPSRPTRGS